MGQLRRCFPDSPFMQQAIKAEDWKAFGLYSNTENWVDICIGNWQNRYEL
jgi:hypothetical protein